MPQFFSSVSFFVKSMTTLFDNQIYITKLQSLSCGNEELYCLVISKGQKHHPMIAGVK